MLDTNTTESAARSFDRSLARIKAMLAMAERMEGADEATATEAATAAYLAGRKAQALGLETDDVWEHWGKGQASAAPWCHFVDGWYDQLEGKERA